MIVFQCSSLILYYHIGHIFTIYFELNLIFLKNFMHPENEVGCPQIFSSLTVSPDSIPCLLCNTATEHQLQPFLPCCPHLLWILESPPNLLPASLLLQCISQYQQAPSANPSRLEVDPYLSSCSLDPMSSLIPSSVTGNLLIGIWVRGYLQEQRLLRDSCIIKT